MKKLIKLLFLFCITILLNSALYGQYFKEKDKVLNIGIGLGSTLYGTGYSTSFPPLSASFEYGLKEGVGPGVVGIGGLLGYTSSKADFNGIGYSYGLKTSYTVIGVRGTYHLVDIADKLDLYGGLMLGYSIVNVTETGTYSSLYGYSRASSGANFSLFAGARYYLTDKFAVMGELGFGFAILNVGVALKF